MLGRTHITVTSQWHVFPHDMCSPYTETDITSNMCSFIQETHITRDLCFLDRATHTCIIREMWFPGKHTHLSNGRCFFTGRGAHITSDLWFPGRGTHITRNCSWWGKHIPLGICVSWVGEVCVFQVEEHVLLGIVPGWRKNIPLGICVCRVGEQNNTCD